MTTEVIVLDDAACPLCDSEGVLVSGAVEVSCAACKPPQVKFEFHQIDLTGLDLHNIRALLDRGWELRDCCYALHDTAGNVEEAHSILRNRARLAAEASDMDLVALHSEGDKKSRQDVLDETLKNAISTKDAGILWKLEPPHDVFSRLFSHEDMLGLWLSSLDTLEANVIFKYVKLRGQAFRWYPSATNLLSYFCEKDKQVFNIEQPHPLTQDLIHQIEEKLFSLESNGFNQYEIDPEIEMFVPTNTIDTVELLD